MTRFVLVLALVLGGCGASALQLNATVANTTAAALDAAGDAIVTTRRAEEDHAVTVAVTRPEAEAEVARVRTRWAPAVAAHDLAAAAQRAYVDAIVAVAAGLKNVADLVPLLAALGRAWRSIVSAVAPLGVTLPALPALPAGLL